MRHVRCLSFVCVNDSYTHATWLFDPCDMTVTWLVRICDMTHSRESYRDISAASSLDINGASAESQIRHLPRHWYRKCHDSFPWVISKCATEGDACTAALFSVCEKKPIYRSLYVHEKRRILTNEIAMRHWYRKRRIGASATACCKNSWRTGTGMSHVTYMNESCHTYQRVMSHIWMRHITRGTLAPQRWPPAPNLLTTKTKNASYTKVGFYKYTSLSMCVPGSLDI